MSSILFTLVVFVTIIIWQGLKFSSQAEKDIQALLDSDIDHITESIYSLVRSQDEAIQQQIDYNLNVARYILHSEGRVVLSNETVTWHAINQFTLENLKISIPKMLIGDEWLGINADFEQSTPIIDTVYQLVGGTITIFQRMNERGDMLRVATNVKRKNGQRAIGTYIPAYDPDPIAVSSQAKNPYGTPNTVVSTLLRGETYRGIAFVVNDWYLTAYEPIFNEKKQVIGALYVGLKQDSFTALRDAIMKVRIGKTGYVFVLEGKGLERGRYIISRNGERDNENIWRAKDAKGQYFVQTIINRAIALEQGRFDTVFYTWQNDDEPQPRQKIARLTYYEPWNWVIGVSLYLDEIVDYSQQLEKRRLNVLLVFITISLIIVVLITGATLIITKNISFSLKHAIQRLQAICYQPSSDSTQNELNLLVETIDELDTYLQLKNQQIRAIISGNIISDSTQSINENDKLTQAIFELDKRIHDWLLITQHHVTTLEQVILPLTQEPTLIAINTQQEIQAIKLASDRIVNETETLTLNTMVGMINKLSFSLSCQNRASIDSYEHVATVNQCVSEIATVSQTMQQTIQQLNTTLETAISIPIDIENLHAGMADTQRVIIRISGIIDSLKQFINTFQMKP